MRFSSIRRATTTALWRDRSVSAPLASGSPLRDLGSIRAPDVPLEPVTGGICSDGREGPYESNADLTIRLIHLDVGAGTTVFFDPNVSVDLSKAGSWRRERRMRPSVSTRTPELGGTWGGLQFLDSHRQPDLSRCD